MRYKTYKLKRSIINQTEEVILLKNNRELKQPRRRRQQKPHKFAYLTIKNRIFARFARAFFIFFFDILKTFSFFLGREMICSCVDDVSISWQMLIFIFWCPKCWFQFNSRVVKTHFFKRNDFASVGVVFAEAPYFCRKSLCNIFREMSAICGYGTLPFPMQCRS